MSTIGHEPVIPYVVYRRVKQGIFYRGKLLISVGNKKTPAGSSMYKYGGR